MAEQRIYNVTFRTFMRDICRPVILIDQEVRRNVEQKIPMMESCNRGLILRQDNNEVLLILLIQRSTVPFYSNGVWK